MINLSSMPHIKQKGYILITTLVLMIMITAMALTQISLNTTQTRVAANAQDSTMSFEKAEGAINEAVNKLVNSTYTNANFLQNNNGFYILDPNNSSATWQTINWSGSTEVIHSFQGTYGAQADYIIEQLPSVVQPGQNMKTATRVYRVTARSVGASGNTSIIIQTTVQIQ